MCVTCCPDLDLVVAEVDLRDAAAVRKLFERESFGRVYHLAAMAGVRASIEQPLLYFDVNVQGTIHLLQAAAACGKPPVVFASSSSVYGGSPRIPFTEDDPVNEPVSPYAASKKAAELACHTYHHLYGLDITCLRFFTVYGPRQRPEMAIHLFTRRILDGESVPMFGDGSTSRDYTYIDDIIDGVVAAGRKAGGYRIYNLGNSHPVALRDLIAKLGEALGCRAAHRAAAATSRRRGAYLGGSETRSCRSELPSEDRSRRGAAPLRRVVQRKELLRIRIVSSLSIKNGGPQSSAVQK